MIEMLHCNCMDYMATLPDKAFELAIVDPEYGHFIVPSENSYLKAENMDGIKDTTKINKGTSHKYFAELFRVSHYQIIWGANYFLDHLPSTPGMIIWDKIIYGNTSLNWGEIAWQNIRQQSRIYRLHTSQTKEVRIHPNQKPVAVYRWLLANYAKPGWKILSTHGGSGSDCIACHDLGYDLTWMELDADYYAAACERY